MIRAGHYDFTAAFPNDCCDLFSVGGDDDAISGTGLHDALPDANDQRRTAEQTKWFSGEPRCAEPGGNDRERAQSTSIGAGRRCKRHAIQAIPLPVEIQPRIKGSDTLILLVGFAHTKPLGIKVSDPLIQLRQYLSAGS